jgi:hypothetical protein
MITRDSYERNDGINDDFYVIEAWRERDGTYSVYAHQGSLPWATTRGTWTLLETTLAEDQVPWCVSDLVRRMEPDYKEVFYPASDSPLAGRSSNPAAEIFGF